MEAFWGEITLPEYLERFSALGGEEGGAIIIFANMLVRIFFIVAGIFAIWQFISAGWMFMTSAGDQKILGQARDKILLTLVGLLIMASSVVFAAIAGILIFGQWDAILNPTITGTPTAP